MVEMIKRVYRDSKLMPEHIFYDNNCTLSKAAHDDPVFKDVALTVDVFHFVRRPCELRSRRRGERGSLNSVS